ncbi:MAG TPA: hypothetical protein VNF02_06400 [Candidatus Limnocylindrales bacterium]|nr:hypothetical protein [Candidatus Limnocylindrales bacterium]
MGRPNRFYIGAGMAALFAVLALLPAARAASTITWKPIGDAILKITGRKPPKSWNVYQDRKKKQRVLVEIDGRYLILDAKTKEVYEIAASQFQQHGKNYQSPDPAGSSHPLPSADWDIRDIGPAERIQVRLTEEKVFLDVELPHPLDLRTAE